MFLDALIDTFIDGIKILPFLFVTYVLMEYIEHKAGSKAERFVKKSELLCGKNYYTGNIDFDFPVHIGWNAADSDFRESISGIDFPDIGNEDSDWYDCRICNWSDSAS